MIQHAQTGIHRSSMWFAFAARLGRGFALAALGLALLAGASALASPAPQSPSDRLSDDDAERARLLGLLTYTRVSISFNGEPARDAFDHFRQVTGLPLVARWNDDALGFGLDPKTPITLEAADKSSLDVLEEMLEQCETFEDCTWQLRKGFVEIGTKERLSVPAARETRVYDIRSFMIEPPYFASGGNGDSTPSELKYAEAFTGKRMQLVRGAGGWVARKKPDELADEIVVLVVETIEPGKWDVGKEDYSQRGDELIEPGAGSTAAPSASGGAASPPPKQPRSVTGVGKWATLRVWRDQLVIKAPDYMHRQINGYPTAIKPSEGELLRAADPSARGVATDTESGFEDSRDAGRPITPAPDGDSKPPADAAQPNRPPEELINPPKSPKDGKKDARP